MFNASWILGFVTETQGVFSMRVLEMLDFLRAARVE